MKLGDVPPPVASFDLPPEQALGYMRSKGLKPTFHWQDMAAGEHAHAFTIAKMMDVDLLGDVRKSLDEALATGKPFAQWQKELTPLLQAKGWWGKKEVLDPLTGQMVTAQLGSAARLETIFRTNLQSAYAAGKWEEIVSQQDEAPYLMYDAIDDDRTRQTHRAWDGTVQPIDSEWWRQHFPPCSWRCRCGVIQLSEDELDALGVKVTSPAPSTATYDWQNPRTGETLKVPVGVDPGFGKLPEKPLTQNAAALMHEKVQALPQDLAASANLGIEQTNKQIAAQVRGRVSKQAAQAAIAEAESVGLEVKAAARAMAAAEALAAEQAAAVAAQEAAALLAAEEAATAQILEHAKAGPTTITGQAYAQLAKEGALAGDPVTALGKLEQQIAAGKLEHQKATLLGGYKSKVVAGKLPTPAQQEAVAALSEAEREALLVEVQKAQDKAQKAAQKVLAAEQAAAAEAAALAAAEAEALALAEAKAAAEAAAIAQAAAEAAAAAQAAAEAAAKALAEQAAKDAAEQLAAEQAAAAEAQATADALKAKKSAAAKKAAATKAANKAKKATAEVELVAAPTKSVTSSTEPLDTSAMVQIGPQRGTNPGGTWQDTNTGEKWYVKFPPSPAMARNEGLTANLYELAGIPAPEYRFATIDGKQGIASRWIEGLEIDKAALVAGIDGVAEGFATDAWLANWDVVGFEYDNLKVFGGKLARRVDTGGGLTFRAQGGLKGAAFGDQVLEIDSMRDPRTAMQASQVFGKLSEQQIEDSVRRVLAVSDADIARVVDQWGPEDMIEREALKARIIARKADLWERFPGARPETRVAAQIPDAGARISVLEQRTIEEARLNGYSIRTDKGEVEDQDVLIAVMEADGKPLTRGYTKLLAKGDAILENAIAQGATGAKTLATVSDLDDDIIALVKGINSRAATGAALDQKTFDRWAALKPRLEAAEQKLRDVFPIHMPPEQTAQAAQSYAYLSEWRTKFTAALEGKAASDTAVALEGVFERGRLRDITVMPEGKASEIAWVKRTSWNTRLADTKKGRAVLTDRRQEVTGVKTVYETQIDGVRVSYVPFAGNPGGRSMQGTLQIDVVGADAESSGRVLEVMEKLGLNVERPTTLDRQELYLNRIARIHTVNSEAKGKAYGALDVIDDPAERVQAKIKHLNKLTGTDITDGGKWGAWQGEHQAFGHGHVHQMRMDLDPHEFNAFAKDHVLYTNPTGLSWNADSRMQDRLKAIINNGGQFASLHDRVRRGIPITDVTSGVSDMESGGGNGIFTRLRRVMAGESRHETAGVYWNPRQIKRTDAISYQNDEYGDTRETLQREKRKVSIAEWKDLAYDGSSYHKKGNETVFKTGISLFDDVEKIVMPSKSDATEFIAWMRAEGYPTWPDGRALADVIVGL